MYLNLLKENSKIISPVQNLTIMYNLCTVFIFHLNHFLYEYFILASQINITP